MPRTSINEIPERAFGSCATCDSHLLCAADCSLAPWNQDRPPTTPFLYILRLRRWAGRPVGYGKLGVGIRFTAWAAVPWWLR